MIRQVLVLLFLLFSIKILAQKIDTIIEKSILMNLFSDKFLYSKDSIFEVYLVKSDNNINFTSLLKKKWPHNDFATKKIETSNTSSFFVSNKMKIINANQENKIKENHRIQFNKFNPVRDWYEQNEEKFDSTKRLFILDSLKSANDFEITKPPKLPVFIYLFPLVHISNDYYTGYFYKISIDIGTNCLLWYKKKNDKFFLVESAHGIGK